VVQDLCALFKVKKIRTAAWHPETDGQVERMNASFAEMLALLVNSRQDDWDDYLSTVTMAYLITPHDFHGMTPFYAAFGRHARTPIDMAMETPSPETEVQDLGTYVEERRHRLTEVWKVVADALDKREEVYKRRGPDRPAMSYASGDLVYVKEPTPRNTGPKLYKHRFTGPWRVEDEIVQGRTYLVRMMARTVRHKTVNIVDMKPFYKRPEHLRMAGDRGESEAPSLLLTKEELSMLGIGKDSQVKISERRKLSGESTWSYRLRLADGSLTPWLEEKEVLNNYPIHPSALDSWHALYDLYIPPESQAPEALRKLKAKKKRGLPVQEALARYPVGTRVLKLFVPKGEPPDAPMEYFEGVVTSYTRPYWYIRYPDGDTEHMNLRQIAEHFALFLREKPQHKL
jgi:hypothetical protein